MANVHILFTSRNLIVSLLLVLFIELGFCQRVPRNIDVESFAVAFSNMCKIGTGVAGVETGFIEFV